MTHKQHRPPPACHILHLPQTLLLKLRVPNRKHFVYHQYLAAEVGGYCEGEADVHAAGVALYGGIQELLYPGEIYYLVEGAAYLALAHAQDGAVEVDVFSARQLRVEACAYLQQAAYAAVEMDLALSGLRDAAEYFEKGALTGPVAAYYAYHVALHNVEGDVPQRPEGLLLRLMEGVAKAVDKGLAGGGVPLGVMGD